MSSWMLSEIVRCGGREVLDDDGDQRAEYRGMLLQFSWDLLRVARAQGFDRWANSTVWEGEAPTTMDALDAVLDAVLDAGEGGDGR